MFSGTSSLGGTAGVFVGVKLGLLFGGGTKTGFEEIGVEVC